MCVYKITIAEPWDFESPDGQNVIKGKIVKTIDAKSVVFETIYMLEFKGEKGNIFILSTRQMGCNFYHFKKDGYLSVNIGLFLGTNINDKTLEELESESLFVMIGGLEANWWVRLLHQFKFPLTT